MTNRQQNSIKLFISLVLMLVASKAFAQVSCGDYIFSNLTLREDLICSGSGFAINPVGSGITINLNGHSIEGPNTMRGISLIGADNIKIVGPGVIRGFGSGISALDSDALEVSDVVFFDVGNGVLLQQASRALISNNKFIFTRAEAVHIRGLATWARTSKANRVVENEFYKSRIGVAICGKNALANSVEGNLIWLSEDWGVHLLTTDLNRILNNDIIEAQSSAVVIENSSKNTVSGNKMEMSRAGLSISTSASNRCGVSDAVSENNTVQYNYATDSRIGVLLGGGPGLVRENKIANNKIYDDEIGIFFATNALDNNARYNGYQGTLEKVIDMGSGNAY